MGNEDEEIRFKITALTNEAIKDAQAYEKAVQKITVGIKELSVVSKTSIAAASDAFKKLAKEIRDTKLTDLSGKLTAAKSVVETAKSGKTVGSPEYQQALESLKQIKIEQTKVREEYAAQIKQISEATKRANAQDMAEMRLKGDQQKQQHAREIANINAEEAEVKQKSLTESANIKQIQQLELDKANAKKNADKAAAANKKKLDKEEEKRLKELNKLTGKTSLKGIFSAVGAGFGIFSALSMLTDAVRSFVNWIRQAAVAAYDFSKSMFALQAGVNAMRRSGIDITTKDILENIQRLRKEFKQFATVDLVKGAAELINLTRDFGYTKEQIFELQDAIVKLAIINGRAMDDVQRTVALAISSGYTEGLQRLGVSINRVTIAEEAQRLGFGRNYLALTEYQRALATYNVILEKTAKYQDDLNAYMETAPGKIDAMNAAWKDFTAKIGTYSLQSAGMLAYISEGFIKLADRAIYTSLGGLAMVLAGLATTLTFVANIAKQAWDNITGKGRGMDIKGAALAAKEAGDAVFKEYVKSFGLIDANSLKETDIIPPIKEMSVEDEEAYQEFFRDLYEIQQEGQEKLLELNEEFGTEMLELDQEFQENSKKAWADYQAELAEISQDELDDIAKENADYQKSLADINSDTNNSIQDANRKYRDDELKAERDFQEKLRRLREEFLYDLEDALRERDALQVLRLIRRYNLDLEQLQRGNEEEQQERQDNYRQELEDIQRQKEEKLRELAEEHAERLAEISAQAERERQEAADAYAQEMAEISREYVEKRAERMKQFEQDKQDLVDSLAAQIQSTVEKFIEMNNLTSEQIALLSSALGNLFGKDGYAKGVFDQFALDLHDLTEKARLEVEAMRGYLDGLQQTISTIGLSGGLPTTLPGNPLGVAGGANLPSTGGKAVGMNPTIFTSPRWMKVGEVPERVEVTPLKDLGGASGAGGRGIISVSLGDGLIGEIIDNTLGEVALVMEGR